MPYYHTIHLPIKTYLKKYLLACYGNKDGKILITPSSDFGDIILAKMSCSVFTRPSDYDAGIYLSKLTDKLNLQIPLDYWYRIQKDLNTARITSINRYFENQFEKDLYQVTERCAWIGIPRKIAIEYFAANHQIELEEDITADALKKVEYRYRKNLSKNKLAGLSPQKNLFDSLPLSHE